MRAEVIGVPDTQVSVRLDAAAVEALNLGDRWAIDVRKRLALSYYSDSLLSLGQAARLAGVTYAEFLAYLHERQVPINYGTAELDEDLEQLKKMGLWDAPVGQ